MSVAAPARRPRTDTPRASFLVPGLVAVVVATFSLTLLAIGARSPYTHANLLLGHDAAYERTQQIMVGAAEPYPGVGDAGGALIGDAIARGARLFVTKGCATCHMLEARGGAVGPAIVGTDAATIEKKARKGPSGMPRYASDALTADEIDAISTYLRSLVGTDRGK